MRRVLLWTVAFAAAVPTTARAEGLPRRPTSVSAVADAAARAATAHDRARLDALASSDGPDPWVVALALVGDDRADAAAAWAGAGRGPGFHGLAVFVASLPDDPVTARAAAAARVAFDAAEDADPVAAAAALAVPAVRASRVLSAYATWVSARATRATTRAPGDSSALAEAAETARRVGWLRLEAVCLHAAGATFVAVGRPALALAPWERRVVVERLRGRAEDELAAHLDLAAAGWSLEQLRTTRAHARAALELAQRLGRRADAARALARLGEADVAAGDVETGTGRLLLAVRELAALGDAQDAARTEAGLGLAHATAGSLGEAARRLDDACTALGGDDGVAAEDVGALDACGRLALATGDTGRARQLLSALRARRARDDDPAELARAEEGLATAARLGGDLEAAVAGYRRAAAAYARAGCVRGSERSVLLAADAAGAAGRPAEAQAAAERALREDGPADPAARAEALAVLARALEAQDRPTEALTTWRLARAAATAAGRSERATEALAGEARAALAARRPDEALAAAAAALDELDGRTAELPDADALRVRAAWACVHEVGVAAARATDDAAAVARFVDAGLAASLRASLSARGALREAAVPPAVRRAEDAALEARAEAAEALQRARAAQDQRAARASQAALEDAQRRLAAAADHGEREARAAAAAFGLRAPALDAVRDRLGPADALVLYDVPDDDAAATAVVVTRAATRWADLGPARALAALVERADLSDRDVLAGPAATRLRDALAAPLALDDDVTRVLVARDGPLAHVPPAVLFPGRVVAVVPSGAVLAALLADGAAPGEGVLAVGDPRDEGAAQAPRVPLPAARDEAVALGTDVLVGAQATRDAVRGALARRPRWKAVHLATHAVAASGRPDLAAVVLAQGPADDGLWTAAEIVRDRVSADVVVLAGCATARGSGVPGEGALGLARAFLLAGAPRVVATLWPVDDEATRAFSTSFHRRLGAGAPAAVALRGAQDDLRADPRWSHPAHWAAWVLVGRPD